MGDYPISVYDGLQPIPSCLKVAANIWIEQGLVSSKLDSRLPVRTVYVLRSLHLEVNFRGVIREDVDLGAIRLVIHIAFAFIGRQYDPVPRRPVVITGVPLGIQQPPVVQPHNVRRREVLENRAPIASIIRFRARWAEGKRKKDWNKHSFHGQKHRWFILDSVPALGFEDLGAHVFEATFWRCRGSFFVPA